MADGKRLTINDLKPKDREVRLVKWPGSDVEVGLMLLRCNELQEAHLAARAWFRKKGQDIDFASAEELEGEEMLQQVFRMLIDPASCVAKDRVFTTDKEARERITSDERDYFIEQHKAFQAEVVRSWKEEQEESSE